MLRKGLTASQEDNSALFIRRTGWGYAPPKPREAFKHKWIVPTLSLTHLIGLFLKTGVTVATAGHQLLPDGIGRKSYNRILRPLPRTASRVMFLGVSFEREAAYCTTSSLIVGCLFFPI